MFASRPPIRFPSNEAPPTLPALVGLRRSFVTSVLIAVAGSSVIGSFSLDTQSVASHFAQARDDSALVARARAIHDRVLTLDSHNDIDPAHFTSSCNYTMRLTTQVNLPKMRDGGLDVSFMIVYVEQGPLTPAGYDNAYREAVAKFDAVHRLTEQLAPKEIGLALTPNDVRNIAAGGRKVAVIGIENGYPIGLDLKRVKEFHDRGGRYMSLAHNGHSQLADSNTGEESKQWRYGGLSPLGKQAIAEMNKWGIMIDVSHPSKGSMMQAIALSKAPVIASHSATRALANVSRNMDDEMLVALKQNGGVIQTVALSAFIKADSPERTAAIGSLEKEFGVADGRGTLASGRRGAGGPASSGSPSCPVEKANGLAPALAESADSAADRLPPERRAQYARRLAEIDEKWPPAGRATVRDFVDHIDYLVKLIGIDHVGIASDFDGGGGVDGWNHAGETFNVTLELVRRGYTEDQIAKVWSGNLLRVWTEVDRVAKEIQARRTN
jgi:membrane dipeptidase